MVAPSYRHSHAIAPKRIVSARKYQQSCALSLNSYVVCLTLLLSILFGHGVGSFAPANDGALQTAVDACISETGDGACPIFAASNDATGNPYDVMGEWDISSVSSLESMFDGKSQFNADISKWDISKVTNMGYAFRSASLFNGDLSKWVLTQVGGNQFYMFSNSGFKRTLCGSGWNEGLQNSRDRGNARLGCCSPGTFMSDPNLNPFSQANSCSGTCSHTGAIAPNVENDDTSCYCGNNDGSSLNIGTCICGTSECDSSTGLFCLASMNMCNTKRMCSNIDGLSLNSENCACGNMDCDSTSGLYCLSSTSHCSTNIITTFTPADTDALKAAVDACISETPDGSCPMFAASDVTSGNQYGIIGDWKTSKVTNLDNMFDQYNRINPNVASKFNADISKWDVSRITSMVQTFNWAVEFEGDLSQWVTSKVTNFRSMFTFAKYFNSDLSLWDTSKASSLKSMFYGCSAFNANLSKWNTSQVTNMASMFFVASSVLGSKFNSPLEYIASSKFNADLSKW